MARGVYQQVAKWYPGVGVDTESQCRAFLSRFAGIKRTGDLVADCWQVQRWYPSDRYDPTSVETVNYSRRVIDVDKIIAERRLP